MPFFKRTKILGTACEFGLSLISLALSECMSHLGLNTNRQHYSKSYDRIGIKFYGGVLGSTMKN